MHFKLIYISAFFLFCIPAKAQNFFRSYGNVDDEIANDVIEGKDSSFFLFGTSSSYLNGSSNFYLLNIDSLGNFLWSKTFGDPGIEQGEAISLKPNGHLLLTGYSNSLNGNYDIFNMEVDSTGTEIWSKYYGGNDWDFAYGNLALPSGESIIAGGTYSYGAGNLDAYLMMIDDIGDSLWFFTYGNIGNDLLRKSMLTSAGEIISVGYTENSSGDKDIYLVKSKTNGDTIWTKKYGTIEDDEGYSVCESETGSYLVCGYTLGIGSGGKEGYYFETDTSGIMLWSQTFGGTANDIFKDIALKTGEDRFYATWETSSYGNGQSDIVITSLYRSGGWYNNGNTYGTAMSESPSAIIYTNHKKVLGVGSTNSPFGNKDAIAILSDTLFPTQSAITPYIDVTAVSNLDNDQLINFYPNPGGGILNISNSEFITAIYIFDLTGNLIRQISDPGHQVDLSSLPPSIYILRSVLDSGKETIHRIAITRQ